MYLIVDGTKFCLARSAAVTRINNTLDFKDLISEVQSHFDTDLKANIHVSSKDEQTIEKDFTLDVII